MKFHYFPAFLTLWEVKLILLHTFWTSSKGLCGLLTIGKLEIELLRVELILDSFECWCITNFPVSVTWLDGRKFRLFCFQALILDTMIGSRKSKKWVKNWNPFFLVFFVIGGWLWWNLMPLSCFLLVVHEFCF